MWSGSHVIFECCLRVTPSWCVEMRATGRRPARRRRKSGLYSPLVIRSAQARRPLPPSPPRCARPAHLHFPNTQYSILSYDSISSILHPSLSRVHHDHGPNIALVESESAVSRSSRRSERMLRREPAALFTGSRLDRNGRSLAVSSTALANSVPGGSWTSLAELFIASGKDQSIGH
jgi:hypothetical protein